MYSFSLWWKGFVVDSSVGGGEERRHSRVLGGSALYLPWHVPNSKPWTFLNNLHFDC